MAPLKIRNGPASNIAAFNTQLSARACVTLPSSVKVTATPRIAHMQPALVTCSAYCVALRDRALVVGGGWTQTAPVSKAGSRARGVYFRHFATDAKPSGPALAGR